MSTRTFTRDTFPGTVTMDELSKHKIASASHLWLVSNGTNDEYSSYHPDVAEMLRRPRIPHGSPEWMLKRKQMMTATNLAAVLGINPWEKEAALFRRKTGQMLDVERNFAMNHGIFYEPEAIDVFQTITGLEVVSDVGLVADISFPWIGASPDGVCKYNPFLIEIKCPQTKIAPECPKYYYTQMQQQMEVCNMDVCFLVQYLPPNSPLSKGAIDIMTVVRDRDWWHEAFVPLCAFWQRVVQYYKESPDPIEVELDRWEDHSKKETKKRKTKSVECMFVL